MEGFGRVFLGDPKNGGFVFWFLLNKPQTLGSLKKDRPILNSHFSFAPLEYSCHPVFECLNERVP